MRQAINIGVLLAAAAATSIYPLPPRDDDFYRAPRERVPSGKDRSKAKASRKARKINRKSQK